MIDIGKQEIVMIIMLGQDKSHGIVLPSTSKHDDYPNLSKFVEKAKNANKPSDASSVI